MTAPIPTDLPDLPAIPGVAAAASAAVMPVVPADAVLPRVRQPLATGYRALIALTAAAGVALELLLGSPLRTLSYFTVQAGALAAVVYALSAGRAWTARRPLPPALTGATLLYVTVAGLVHHLVVADATSGPSMTGGQVPVTGWHAVSLHLLHTALPLAALLDWLLLTRPASLRLSYAASWLVCPLLYAVLVAVLGALSLPDAGTRYLYPFLNPQRIGYIGALGNATVLGLTFYGLGVLLVALDHIRPGARRRRSS
ncbi:Pr6Pr family membrane protein [Streptomyces minutiscleroticus]|uniref:Pr6Pr family membrane protein n=1 Tax=Streptomyces minutiscleroticus TaxID=68238 RepID=UPI00331B530D